MTEQNQATKTSRSGDTMDYAHTQRSTIGRGIIAAASTAAAVLVLTGCSDASEDPEAADTEETAVAEEENSEQEWFAAECPTITADVRQVEGEEATGEITGTALVQGPVSPPEGLDESTMTIGMYSYDELDDALVFEKIATESDVFCLTADLDEGPDSDTEFVGQEAENSASQMHHMASFDNPEGFWVDEVFWTTGASVPGVIVDHDCPGAWTVAEDLADLDNAEHQEEGVGALYMQGADPECL